MPIDPPLPYKISVRLKALGLLPTETNLPIFTYRHGMASDSPTTAYFSEDMLAKIDWLKETWAPTPLTALAWFGEEHGWGFARKVDRRIRPGDNPRDGATGELYSEWSAGKYAIGRTLTASNPTELVEKILDAIGVK